MRSLFPAALLVSVLVLLAAATVSSTAAPAACTPGVKEVPGGSIRTFCGPARAAVTVNGKSYAIKGGKCDLYPKGLVVNIGTVALLNANKRVYFGMLLGRSPGTGPSEPAVSKGGTYGKGQITIDSPGLPDGGISIYNWPGLKIVLKDGRRAGTFSAAKPAREAFGIKVPAINVKGSFRC